MIEQEIRNKALEKLDSAIKATETRHENKAFENRQYLLLNGVEAIDLMMKRKGGVLTTMRLDLDPPTVADRATNRSHESNSILEFRLLTALEEQEIQDYIDKTYDYAPDDVRRFRIMTALTLSYASRIAPPDYKPAFTYKELLATIPANTWFALANKYADFVQRYSPAVETVTQEEIDKIVDVLVKEEDTIKKLDLLAGMSLMETQDTLLTCINKLRNALSQLEQLST